MPGQGPVLRPKGVKLHYEVELGVVVGKTLRDIDAASLCKNEEEKRIMDAISGRATKLSPFLFSPWIVKA